MNIIHTRREFLKTTSAALALAAAGSRALAAEEKSPPRPPANAPIKKGIMWATVGVKGSVLEKMKAIKTAGFDGVEMMSHMDADEIVRARDETGLEIPSVCGALHWGKPLSDPDPKVREEGLEG
jgi:hexulose-6-phosphate isomerase